MTTETVEDAAGWDAAATVARFRSGRAVDAAAVVREDAARTKRHELERALDALVVTTELDDADRDALRALAESVVAGVVGEPVERLARVDDPADVDAALDLFDLEPPADAPAAATPEVADVE